MMLIGLLAVYPMIYTFYVSFTNYSEGNRQTKTEAVRKGNPDRSNQRSGRAEPEHLDLGSGQLLNTSRNEGDTRLTREGLFDNSYDHRLCPFDE